jgi:hypothetical protein
MFTLLLLLAPFAAALFFVSLLGLVGLCLWGVKSLLFLLGREARALYLDSRRPDHRLGVEWGFRLLALPFYLLSAAALFYGALALLLSFATPSTR